MGEGATLDIDIGALIKIVQEFHLLKKEILL